MRPSTNQSLEEPIMPKSKPYVVELHSIYGHMKIFVSVVESTPIQEDKAAYAAAKLIFEQLSIGDFDSKVYPQD